MSSVENNKKRKKIIIISSVIASLIVVLIVLLVIFLVVLPRRNKSKTSSIVNSSEISSSGILFSNSSSNTSGSFMNSSSFSIHSSSIPVVSSSGPVTSSSGPIASSSGPVASSSAPVASSSAPVASSSGPVASSTPPPIQCFNGGPTGRLFNFVSDGAGSGNSPDSPPIDALTALIRQPIAICVDNTRCAVYFSDQSNSKIRKVTLDTSPQLMSTALGRPPPFPIIINSNPLASNLGLIVSMAVSRADGCLYIASTSFDSGVSGFIVRFDPDAPTASSLSLYSGSPTNGTSSPDGPVSSATYGRIFGLTIDPTGNFIYVGESGWIRRINITTGQVARFAGNGSLSSSIFTSSLSTALNGLSFGTSTSEMVCDSSGNLYVACETIDSSTIQYIVLVQSDGLLAKRFFNLFPEFPSNTVSFPVRIPLAIDRSDRLYFLGGWVLRRFSVSDLSQTVTVVAGVVGGPAPNNLATISPATANVDALTNRLGANGLMTIDDNNNFYICLGNVNIQFDSCVRRVSLPA